ncbi:hypothetical protein PMZ80_000945 [Knufia obscura]|uniref:Phosphogluconate dehydrogenase NAD-binding putative C-terminal domain-containing protein n=1 Tax=Knufia obscura TaxID=1635080 RepID=A0ABR0S1R5_9EURO|nr:hypothetical protein PMZ80_000945 [Knufia obscura]
MASSSTPSKPSIGILSIGDMDRIRAAKITDVASDDDLLAQADIILSIVPPRDALATAKRVADACKSAAAARKDRKGSDSSVMYIDLNAISPRTVAKIFPLFHSVPETPPAPSTPSLARRLTRTLSLAGQQLQDSNSETPPPPPITIKFLDGGIIGSPPSREKDKSKDNADSASSSTSGDASTSTTTWKRPSIPVSGPHESILSPDLISTLNMKFVSDKIGTASALKACFASLTKGFTALSILSYTTAATCGVLPELKSHLDEFVPGLSERAERGMTGMPPKAYRWVDEMREIGKTFKSSGGMKFGGELFDQVGEVYRFVSEDTVLGGERVGKRKRGTTVEDVAECVEEGVQRKMQKGHPKDEKLELAWRGSWGL